jgi:flagellar motor switch protein FliM
MQGFASEPDEHWTNLLNDQVHEAPVTAVAVLARKQMLLREITSLSVGDIIPIEINDPVTVYVDGLPVIKGQYGVKEGRYSVKVSTIQHPAEFLKSPLEKARLGPSMMRSAEKGELYEQPAENPQTFAPMPTSEANKRGVSSDTIGQSADELEPNEPDYQAGTEEIKEDQNG